MVSIIGFSFFESPIQNSRKVNKCDDFEFVNKFWVIKCHLKGMMQKKLQNLNDNFGTNNQHGFIIFGLRYSIFSQLFEEVQHFIVALLCEKPEQFLQSQSEIEICQLHQNVPTSDKSILKQSLQYIPF